MVVEQPVSSVYGRRDSCSSEIASMSFSKNSIFPSGRWLRIIRMIRAAKNTKTVNTTSNPAIPKRQGSAVLLQCHYNHNGLGAHGAPIWR